MGSWKSEHTRTIPLRVWWARGQEQATKGSATTLRREGSWPDGTQRSGGREDTGSLNQPLVSRRNQTMRQGDYYPRRELKLLRQVSPFTIMKEISLEPTRQVFKISEFDQARQL